MQYKEVDTKEVNEYSTNLYKFFTRIQISYQLLIRVKKEPQKQRQPQTNKKQDKR
jgi:hypothetical protein